MTTTVRVTVNGNYRTTIKQDDREPVVIGPGSMISHDFILPHPAHGIFEVTEEQVQPEGQRRVDDNGD